MPITLSETPTERSTYVITVGPFTDETGAAVTPSAITWTLTDTAGTVVNSRSAVSVTPASTVTVVLSGADLALAAAYRGRGRVFTVETTYTSSNGANLPYKEQAKFTIEGLIAVT